MTEISLREILDAREKRVARQKELLYLYNSSLISFTMNIAGPVKNSPLIERSFYEGIRLLKEQLPKGSIIHEQTHIATTGCESLFCVNAEASYL